MHKQSLCTDDCIDEIIGRYSVMVYQIAFSRVQSKSDANDVFQDVFLRYISKERSFESEEHRKAWLIRVTVNCCKKLSMSAWFRKTVPLEEAETFNTPYEPARIELTDLLSELSPDYRTVIYLFYYEDLTVEQISKYLNRKPSTIRTQLTRARRVLKDKLEGDFCDE